MHDLKHTFGRRLRAAGVSYEDRQDLLGHKSGRITTHYSAGELENLIEAVNRVCGDNSRKSPALVLLKQKAVTAEDDNRLNVEVKNGAPGRIRTSDHLVRSQVLYPTELRARCEPIIIGLPPLERQLSFTGAPFAVRPAVALAKRISHGARALQRGRVPCPVYVRNQKFSEMSRCFARQAATSSACAVVRRSWTRRPIEPRMASS